MFSNFGSHKEAYTFWTLLLEKIATLSVPYFINSPLLQRSLVSFSNLFEEIRSISEKIFRWLHPFASYQEWLETWNFLPLCYILIEKDMLLLWRILNAKIDSDFSSKISFSVSSIATRSNVQPLLEMKICSKFKTHDNFFLRSVGTGNYHRRNRVIDFGWPFQKFKSSLHSYL